MTTQQAILLVEDNDDEAELTLRAFRQAKIANPIVRARDGVEALEILFRDTAQLPVVVLLDLRLPRLDGIDVLKAIRADPRTTYVPVVLLTSSDHDRDRLSAYENHANSFVQKPVDYDEFVGLARQLGTYWTEVNKPVARVR
ncbi:MAG TPA: response regulator [Kofleriaceae bacterium]|jgi:two-component system response regulator